MNIMVSTKILNSMTVFNIDDSNKCFLCSKSALEWSEIYIYAFSRRFYPKRLTLHSSYSFTFDQLLLSLGIEPMILALLAPCSTIWATGKPVISHEISCDTEDWSNDAENSALITGINYILQYIHIAVTFNCNNISQFCSIFDQINAVVEGIRDQPQTFEW